MLAVVEVRLLLRYARAGLPDRHPGAARREPTTTGRSPSPTEPTCWESAVELTTVWFLLIAVLLTGYFVLEGFDFGVGMLLPVLGRDDRERRVLINTIGPVWDGNEVWLITAGGAMFAAFPEWYATLFSGFYLPLLLILLALIVRGVAFEYRGKRARARAGSAAGTCASSSARWCRRCCGASRSPTSCAACRSTPTTSTSAASSTCSTRTRCSAA